MLRSRSRRFSQRFSQRFVPGLAFAGVAAFGACATPDQEAPPEGPAARRLAPVETPEGVANLVLRNGKVATLVEGMPEVSALAARGGAIVALGTDVEIATWIGDGTEVIDLAGGLAIPGFIEGHGHFMGLGDSKLILDLTTTDTWQDIIDMVAAAAQNAEPGEWIAGRGWHQEKWSVMPDILVDGIPVHDDLSAVSPDNPVILTHASGHATFANAKALELAGIDASTPDPAGGEIVHDDAGEPTGHLRETSQRLVRAAKGEADAERTEAEVDARRREQVRLANAELLRKGITSFHDAGAGLATVDLYKTMADEGQLPVRLYVMLGGGYEQLQGRLDEYRMIGYADNRLTVRSIKQVIDGALGSHGAWLLQPYADMPSSSGLATTPPEQIERVARLAIEHGYQVNTHAIGDRGNREVLNLYERTFADYSDQTDLRWRIEHAQHIDPDDIPRFGELGVIASMQGIHACSDGPWIMLRLGEGRARSGAYVWQDLRAAGAMVTNGTDVPVEDVDPLESYHCTVTRQVADGSAFFSDQAMTREEALRSYTLSNAYAAFEEEIKGTLAVGKLADITVLSRDILTIPADEILGTQVDYTIIGGIVEYARQP